MSINKKMMKNMKKEYGSKKGEQVYYAMENKMKHKMVVKGGKMVKPSKKK